MASRSVTRAGSPKSGDNPLGIEKGGIESANVERQLHGGFATRPPRGLRQRTLISYFSAVLYFGMTDCDSIMNARQMQITVLVIIFTLWLGQTRATAQSSFYWPKLGDHYSWREF